MKKIICMFLTLLLSVCIVGCSQTKDSDNHVVQDYSEEYEVSPYGSEEELDTLDDLKISMSTEKDLDLKHLSFLIENTSDKEYRYSPNYFEIEAEQSGTWYQLEQLDDPSKSNEKDCFIKPNERLPGKCPCSLSRYFGGEQRRPGCNEDCIAAFQRLHSKSFHAEAL